VESVIFLAIIAIFCYYVFLRLTDFEYYITENGIELLLRNGSRRHLVNFREITNIYRGSFLIRQSFKWSIDKPNRITMLHNCVCIEAKGGLFDVLIKVTPRDPEEFIKEVREKMNRFYEIENGVSR
jgi:hypothetical protein